ncbi:DUF5412 family protein [Actinomycetes bacterium NPDC127524]
MTKRCNIWSFYLCLLCLTFSFLLIIFSDWELAPAYIPWFLSVIAFIIGIIGFKDKSNRFSKARSWFTLVFSLLLSLFFFLGVIRLFIISEELFETSHSPDNKYTIDFYLGNGGATTSYFVVGKVKGPLWFEKTIYYDYRMTKAKVEWINSHTVSINNHKLDLEKGETYSNISAI